MNPTVWGIVSIGVTVILIWGCIVYNRIVTKDQALDKGHRDLDGVHQASKVAGLAATDQVRQTLEGALGSCELLAEGRKILTPTEIRVLVEHNPPFFQAVKEAVRGNAQMYQTVFDAVTASVKELNTAICEYNAYIRYIPNCIVAMFGNFKPYGVINEDDVEGAIQAYFAKHPLASSL